MHPHNGWQPDPPPPPSSRWLTFHTHQEPQSPELRARVMMSAQVPAHGGEQKDRCERRSGMEGLGVLVWSVFTPIKLETVQFGSRWGSLEQISSSGPGPCPWRSPQRFSFNRAQLSAPPAGHPAGPRRGHGAGPGWHLRDQHLYC